MADETIVVTGAGGFIGGALVKRLGSMGLNVCGLVRNDTSAARVRASCHSATRVRIEVCDVRNGEHVRKYIAGAHTVYHAAALVNSSAPERQFVETNVEGTRNVVSAALAAEVSRLIYLSTTDVFGLPANAARVTEIHHFRKWEEKYPDTKIAATELVQEFRDRGLPATIVYPGWVYGPGDQQFLPSLTTQLRSGVLPTWGTPALSLHLVHIDDLVEGLILCGTTPGAVGHDFILLDPDRVPLATICDAVGAFYGFRYRTVRIPYWAAMCLARAAQALARCGLTCQPLITTAIVKSFGMQFSFDVSNARARLGWEPAKRFKEGIRNALEWQMTHVAGNKNEREHDA